MDTVYLETSIIGYLTSRPSRDLLVAAHQQITHEWWELHRASYELFVSEAVVAECSAGDSQAAQERLDRLSGLPFLDVSEAAERLAEDLLRGIPLPAKANIDALHMALATVNGIDYVLRARDNLTWPFFGFSGLDGVVPVAVEGVPFEMD